MRRASSDRRRDFRKRLRAIPEFHALEGRLLLATLSIFDVTVLQGAGDTPSAVFTVALSSPSRARVTVKYKTADGSATAAGHDFAPVHGTLTFQPRQTVQTIAVPILGGSGPAPDETFQMVLSRPARARLGRSVGTATLHDETLTVSNATVGVPYGGGADAVFTVQLSDPSPAPVSVQYGTVDGTASAAAGDYAPTFGSLTLPPGQTTGTRP
jgi:hypothetical protein